MKLAAIKIDQVLSGISSECKQLLQIHDSFLVECPEAYAEAVAAKLKETMEAIYSELPVKLTVETMIGNNWGEL
jgi:DNA polymerase I-like protein with 3'-5' exonuclease and polymerase domains